MHGGQIQVTGRDLEIGSYADHLGEGSGRTLAEARTDQQRSGNSPPEYGQCTRED